MREMHLIIEVVFDKQDAQKRADALQCLRVMVDEAARRGYGEYRTHLALMDQVAQTYAWGEGALGKLHETIKDAVDPNGILAPGKCGVWPRRYKGQGWEMLNSHNSQDNDGHK
jgi:FAD/FMN-containing dehydrogenase